MGVTKFDPLLDYHEKVFSLVPISAIKSLKVVVDAGNGMAKATIPALLSQLPIQVEYLFLEPDGNFPNHEANPLKVETLKSLQEKVKSMGADLGFALDGDADRIGLVDENGEVVEASFVGALAGLEIIRRYPQGSLLTYDLRSSRVVPEVWEQAGAKTAQSPVGHALIKAQMKAVGAVFGSELSLHLYFQEMYNCESPDLALMIFLALLSRTGEKLSALVAPLKKYFHSGEINFKIMDKDKIIQTLKDKYNAAQLSELDGWSFTFSDFWFNVRMSNTEPVLRLNLEANTEELMKAKVKEITNIIQ